MNSILMSYDRLFYKTQSCDVEQRQFGKTTSAIELARRVNGILLCLNSQQANLITAEHGIRTAPIDSFDSRGRQQPIIVDQDAAMHALGTCLRELHRASERVEELELRLQKIHQLSSSQQ